MTILEKDQRNLQIAVFMSTPTGTDRSGKVIYPTYNQAGAQFNLHPTHVFIVIKKLKEQGIFKEENGVRTVIQ